MKAPISTESCQSAARLLAPEENMHLAMELYHKHQDLIKMGKKYEAWDTLGQAVRYGYRVSEIMHAGFLVRGEIDNEMCELYNNEQLSDTYNLLLRFEIFYNCINESNLLNRRNKCLHIFMEFYEYAQDEYNPLDSRIRVLGHVMNRVNGEEKRAMGRYYEELLRQQSMTAEMNRSQQSSDSSSESPFKKSNELISKFRNFKTTAAKLGSYKKQKLIEALKTELIEQVLLLCHKTADLTDIAIIWKDNKDDHSLLEKAKKTFEKAQEIAKAGHDAIPNDEAFIGIGIYVECMRRLIWRDEQDKELFEQWSAITERNPAKSKDDFGFSCLIDSYVLCMTKNTTTYQLTKCFQKLDLHGMSQAMLKISDSKDLFPENWRRAQEALGSCKKQIWQDWESKYKLAYQSKNFEEIERLLGKGWPKTSDIDQIEKYRKQYKQLKIDKQTELEMAKLIAIDIMATCKKEAITDNKKHTIDEANYAKLQEKIRLDLLANGRHYDILVNYPKHNDTSLKETFIKGIVSLLLPSCFKYERFKVKRNKLNVSPDNYQNKCLDSHINKSFNHIVPHHVSMASENNSRSIRTGVSQNHFVNRNQMPKLSDGLFGGPLHSNAQNHTYSPTPFNQLLNGHVRK